MRTVRSSTASPPCSSRAATRTRCCCLRRPSSRSCRRSPRHRRGAVGELDALFERERPAQPVLRLLPRLGEPRNDLVVLVERHEVVEDLVREVGLLDPAAEHAGRLLLVRVDDRPALDALARGRRGRAGAPRQREGCDGSGGDEGEGRGTGAHGQGLLREVTDAGHGMTRGGRRRTCYATVGNRAQHGATLLNTEPHKVT